MKILLIDVYNYNKGGAETVCFNTGKMLEAHGHKVIYFTLKWADNKPSPYSKYFPESKETRRGPLKQIKNMVNYFYHFEAAKKIEQLILDEKPEIAHIHLIWGQITPSIFPVLKKYNIPILFTVHDYRIVCPAYTFRNGKGQICEECQGKYFYKCFTNRCCKGSKLMSMVMATEQYFRNKFFNPAQFIDGFIYVSNFAKNIQEKYMPAVKSTPNIILYNFSTSIIQKGKSTPKDKYFLFFGRLSYEKGLKTLLTAFKDIPECKLKVVGTGPKEEELKQFVLKTNMQNVDFLGYKQGKELSDLVYNAYFVVVPSEWYENNPMTIIEAYSVGTPVIGAKIGGIPEIVDDGKTGFQFTSANVEELKAVILKTNNLSNEEYSTISNNTIKFANDNLSPHSYWNKLIGFYSNFLKSE
jgi:glycosyltransferase involved in cell wall biosynthesis